MARKTKVPGPSTKQKELKRIKKAHERVDSDSCADELADGCLEDVKQVVSSSSTLQKKKVYVWDDSMVCTVLDQRLRKQVRYFVGNSKHDIAEGWNAV